MLKTRRSHRQSAASRSSRLKALIFSIVLPCAMGLFALESHADRLADEAILSQRADESLLLAVTQAGNRLVAVGDQGVVLLSDTQGQQWRQVSVPTSVMLTAVNFVNDSEGWAVGHDGVLLHTLDGGEQWLRVLTGNEINALQVVQFQAMVDAGEDTPQLPMADLELYLDDALAAQEDGPTLPLLNVFFTDQRHGFLLGAYGLLLATSDGGASWDVLSHRVPNPDRFHLNAMASDGTHLYIAGEAGVLFRSADHGDTWEALESPYDGSFFDISTYQNSIVLAGLRGHLFQSQDDGTTWQPIAVKSPSTFSVIEVNNDKLLVAGQGGTVMLGDTLDSLTLLDQSDRRAWSGAASIHNGWVLVGEKGVKLINQQGDPVVRSPL